MTTNEFERDLNDQAGLKRPGRIDLRVLQNTADAGDGHPGVQRCFRNYLHEGGMEKDLDLIAYGIKGTSVNINNAELQQLSNIGTSIISVNEWSQIANIGAVTINGTQWGYVGDMDQSVKQADSPTFGGLTINGNITISGNVDGVDVSDLKTAFDNHKASSGVDHTYINQDLRTTFSPTFVGLTLSANLVTNSTVDGVDVSLHAHSGAGQGGTVSYTNLNNRGHVLSGGDHTASELTVGYVIRATGETTFAWQQLAHGDLSGIGSNAHSVIDTHLGDLDKHSGVQPMLFWADDGFVMVADKCVCYEVACSDTSANIYFNFNVQDAGTYWVHIWTTGTVDGSTQSTTGLMYVGEKKIGEVLSWNVADGVSKQLLIYDTAYTVANNELQTDIVVENETIVIVKWSKTGNCAGRTGNFQVLGAYLERKA